MSSSWLPFALGSLLIFATACGDDDAPTDTGAADTSTGDTGRSDGAVDTGTGGDAGCIAASGRCDTGDTCCGELVCREASSGDGFCVEVDDLCFVGAQSGCCLDDADCEGEATCYGAECRSDGDGMCKDPPPAGECWGDGDCGAGMTCMGAVICPCGAECLVPDELGTCG